MLKKTWFNRACSLAIQGREAAHKRFLSLRTPAYHDLYTAAQNHAKSVLLLTKNSHINRQIQTRIIMGAVDDVHVAPLYYPLSHPCRVSFKN